MFNNLTADAPDRVMITMQQFREDPRTDKLDLGVGVYKDADGRTPIMRAIKSAEKVLWEMEDTKTYVGLTGDIAFNTSMRDLVLGDISVPEGRVASAATPGGTGAVRAAFELIKMANPEATVWISNPSWSNHPNMLNYLGIQNRTYRYFNATTGTLDFEGMMADLGTANSGDIVLLHGCCHNPTGLNLSEDQWHLVAALMQKQGLIPMIDIAYQGFGDGLEEDAFGTRLVATALPQVLIAASCSKNFGIYRERTGCFIALGQAPEIMSGVQGKLALINRLNYSFPPDHGARLVTMVLNDPSLRAEWENELDDIRKSMLSLRKELATELQRQTNSDRFNFVAEHRGMFSMLGLTQDQVSQMRVEHGVYAISDSRINIAGLNETAIPVLARAVASVI